MLFFLPLDVLDEIWDLVESVSGRFPTYFRKLYILIKCYFDLGCIELMHAYFVMYKTIFVINIILHMCLQHSNTL